MTSPIYKPNSAFKICRISKENVHQENHRRLPHLDISCRVDDPLTTCVNSCLPQCIETAPGSLRPKCKTACLQFCTAN
uniref:Uncharacterized protein n=1 Tax=Salix viminalis TaxID=40686 RepID=A0A6N2LZT0_SALVM